MDDVLIKLGGFVSSSDSRVACAAAVILAELAPRNSSIVKELIRGLDHPDPVRRQFIIEALGRIGTADSAAALVPLIKAGGQSSELALRAIAHTASTALKPLLRLIGSVPPALLERIAECVGRTGEAVAFSSLLDHLNNADVDVCRAVRGGLRTAMSIFDDRAKESLRKQLEKAFQDKALASQQPALIALLKIAGDLGHVGLQKFLFDRIDNDEPAHVRRAALQAIARLHYTGDQRARQAGRLLPLMLEPDLVNIAETALEATRSASATILGAEQAPVLRKLLNSQSSRIREFAMQTLATQSSSRTLHELIACLDNPDRAIREEALSALSRAPSAAAALAERLLEVKAPESIQEVARALQGQSSQIPTRLLAQMAEVYVNIFAAQRPKDHENQRAVDERRRALLSIFRAAHSPLLAAAALGQAIKLRKKGEDQKAFELLRSASGVQGWSDEHRFELALAGLAYSPKDMARMSRNADPNLQALQEVFFGGRKSVKDVVKALTKDAALNRRAVYYVGFHFVERMQNEREFGKLLLEQLAESRSEEGKLAREKLIIEGLAQVKGGKAGILEERAKVLLVAEDMVSAERAREERKAARPERNGKPARSDRNGKATVRKPQPKPAKAAKAARPSRSARPARPARPVKKTGARR